MIGVMIPGVFAEKVSNYIGSAIIDENSYRFTHGGSIGVTVYGSVNCDDCVYVWFHRLDWVIVINQKQNDAAMGICRS